LVAHARRKTNAYGVNDTPGGVIGSPACGQKWRPVRSDN
jgi:hypothetical protein